jgi:hypothetical protein
MPIAQLNDLSGRPSFEPRAGQHTRSALSVPLFINSPGVHQAVQPVTVGVPFPAGSLLHPAELSLVDQEDQPAALQSLPLARWADGSIQWLLLDFLLRSLKPGVTTWTLHTNPTEIHNGVAKEGLRVVEAGQIILVDTGVAEFHISRATLQPFTRVLIGGHDLLVPCMSQVILTDTKGRKRKPQVNRVSVEARGPVRATVLLEGAFTGRPPCRFAARLCFFRGTGLVRIRLTVHNPRRARHRGGLWDLGDPGSILFRELSLDLTVAGSQVPRTYWAAEAGQPFRAAESSPLEIYQDSSGGENWQSRNHVNRLSQVPCSFRGYRVRVENHEETGMRASPTVAVHSGAGSVMIGIPEFWQQFPKAIEVEDGRVRIGLFPRQFSDLFELQGGEQKTHTVWLDFSSLPPSSPAPLDWLHEPASVHSSPEWYAESRAISCFAPALSKKGTVPLSSNGQSPFSAQQENRLDSLLSTAVAGSNSFFDRREIIDEYGWRNFGEVYADHEAAYYTGPCPVISHYNNQYDLIYGTLLQYLRTGDPRWFQLADPLARHVMDIDIYHTSEDKAAYNGGLFWFTDHYKDAATCTHRTYSRHNLPPGKGSYGGGPSSNHNFTTGLLTYYFLTGDPNARAAVLSLADWVMAMDDGRNNVLGWLDPGPTGLASGTGQLEYQGAGRGAGNSIQALLAAWILSGQRLYLDQAETLLHRCVHPRDDIDELHLLNAEKRWSYTVFLSAVARYLEVKEEAGEMDDSYAYGRASLVHYAKWMLENERPYFDQIEQLEYPTEAWPAQELRKANVLRLAARYVEEPLRARLIQRAVELSERGWTDLYRFETRTSARALAIVLAEGPKEAYLRSPAAFASASGERQVHDDSNYPMADAPRSPSTRFIPQKTRVRNELRSVAGLVCLFLRCATSWFNGGTLDARNSWRGKQ